MDIAIFIASWLGSPFLSFWLAGEKGRGQGRWFGFGLLLGPVALVALGLSPNKK